MCYQYKREPLTSDEANRLANACKTHEEKLVVWTLLDTGLRVAELANLTQDTSPGKQHRLVIYS
jgi:integrase/recombinase XerD